MVSSPISKRAQKALFKPNPRLHPPLIPPSLPHMLHSWKAFVCLVGAIESKMRCNAKLRGLNLCRILVSNFSIDSIRTENERNNQMEKRTSFSSCSEVDGVGYSSLSVDFGFTRRSVEWQWNLFSEHSITFVRPFWLIDLVRLHSCTPYGRSRTHSDSATTNIQSDFHTSEIENYAKAETMLAPST